MRCDLCDASGAVKRAIGLVEETRLCDGCFAHFGLQLDQMMN